MQLLIPCLYLGAGPCFAQPLARSMKPLCECRSPMFIVLLAHGAETLPWTPAASPWLTFIFQLLAKAAELPGTLL